MVPGAALESWCLDCTSPLTSQVIESAGASEADSFIMTFTPLVAFVALMQIVQLSSGTSRSSSLHSHNTSGCHSQRPCHLNAENYAKVAARVASSEGQIVLTTLSFASLSGPRLQDHIEMTQNFAMHLQEVGRLENTLILSQDFGTCEALEATGVPCLIDRASPSPASLPEQYANSAHLLTKFWHAAELTLLSLEVLFIDNDVVTLKDPFQSHDRSFDIEGLSDWLGADLPTHKQVTLGSCGRYKIVLDPSVKGGQYLSGSGGAETNLMRYVHPCQSTGLWFVQPSVASRRFLKDMLDWLIVEHPTQWEQSAFNEIIVANLMGLGKEPGLRYRLLPTEMAMNIYGLESDLEKRHDLVMLHAGGLEGNGKIAGLKRHSEWRPSEWLAQRQTNSCCLDHLDDDLPIS